MSIITLTSLLIGLIHWRWLTTNAPTYPYRAVMIAFIFGVSGWLIREQLIVVAMMLWLFLAQCLLTVMIAHWLTSTWSLWQSTKMKDGE